MSKKKAKVKGKLPNSKWLQLNGYCGLDQCMRKYPELFKYIEQDWRGGKIIEEHIKIAEKLVKKNDGILQNTKWLQLNGYRSLDQCMRKHPELFKHIIQDYKGGKTSKQHIKDAEELAKKNNGKLPNKSWLAKNGFRGLVHCLENYPKLFVHIKQDIKIRTYKDHVKDAEKMVKENNGVLPSFIWLFENGYKKLARYISKNPEKFSYIKQETKIKTIEQWVLIAEDLVKENNGILQNRLWLLKNGYSGLDYCKNKYPDKFSHIKQNYKGGKASHEWIQEAEKLAKCNNEILPNSKWLQKNGYSGLDQRMRKCPELFEYIKQENKKHNVLDSWDEQIKKLKKNNGGILPCGHWLKTNGYNKIKDALRNHPEIFRGIKQEYHVGKVKKVRIIGE